MGFSHPEGLGMISLAWKGNHSQRTAGRTQVRLLQGSRALASAQGRTAAGSLEAVVLAHLSGSAQHARRSQLCRVGTLGPLPILRSGPPGPPDRAGLPMSPATGEHVEASLFPLGLFQGFAQGHLRLPTPLLMSLRPPVPGSADLALVPAFGPCPC